MGMTRADLVRLIREAGRVPVERDTLYGVVEELPARRRPRPRSSSRTATKDAAWPWRACDMREAFDIADARASASRAFRASRT